MVVVFGAGAIGGFIAGALAHSGVETGVVARGDHLKAIKQHGLRIESVLGRFEARVTASNDLRDFDNPAFVLLTCKSHQWHGVLPQFDQAVNAAAPIATLLN